MPIDTVFKDDLSVKAIIETSLEYHLRKGLVWANQPNPCKKTNNTTVTFSNGYASVQYWLAKNMSDWFNETSYIEFRQYESETRYRINYLFEYSNGRIGYNPNEEDYMISAYAVYSNTRFVDTMYMPIYDFNFDLDPNE